MPAIKLTRIAIAKLSRVPIKTYSPTFLDSLNLKIDFAATNKPIAPYCFKRTKVCPSLN